MHPGTTRGQWSGWPLAALLLINTRINTAFPTCLRNCVNGRPNSSTLRLLRKVLVMLCMSHAGHTAWLMYIYRTSKIICIQCRPIVLLKIGESRGQSINLVTKMDAYATRDVQASSSARPYDEGTSQGGKPHLFSSTTRKTNGSRGQQLETNIYEPCVIL